MFESVSGSNATSRSLTLRGWRHDFAVETAKIHSLQGSDAGCGFDVQHAAVDGMPILATGEAAGSRGYCRRVGWGCTGADNGLVQLNTARASLIWVYRVERHVVSQQLPPRRISSAFSGPSALSQRGTTRLVPQRECTNDGQQALMAKHKRMISRVVAETDRMQSVAGSRKWDRLDRVFDGCSGSKLAIESGHGRGHGRWTCCFLHCSLKLDTNGRKAAALTHYEKKIGLDRKEERTSDCRGERTAVSIWTRSGAEVQHRHHQHTKTRGGLKIKPPQFQVKTDRCQAIVPQGFGW